MTLQFIFLNKPPLIEIYCITALRSFPSAACEAHAALGVLRRAAEQTAVIEQPFTPWNPADSYELNAAVSCTLKITQLLRRSNILYSLWGSDQSLIDNSN